MIEINFFIKRFNERINKQFFEYLEIQSKNNDFCPLFFNDLRLNDRNLFNYSQKPELATEDRNLVR